MSESLSKSNFKVARTCPTKLYYLKNSYPSTKSDNSYLEFLADGGFMIGKMAKIIHPEGIDLENLSGSSEELSELARAHLKRGSVTLFEATVHCGGLVAKIDILKKLGNTVDLIEVKSKSFDSDDEAERRAKNGQSLFCTTKGDGILSDWKEYIEDIAFQVITFERANPGIKVNPFLLLPDKAKTTSIDNLFSWFALTSKEKTASGYRKVSVEFTGDEQRLRDDHFLIKVDVSNEVEIVRGDVTEAMDRFLASLVGGAKKIEVPIGRQCKDCEFRSDGERSGFKECLGSLAEIKPHIFEAYYGTELRLGKKYLFDSLLSEGKASLFDIPDESIKSKRGIRQSIQITNTRANHEWFSDQLRKIVESVSYPIHFVDFETTRIAVPYHAGMRPYEQVAFQFSCHMFDSATSVPIHTEWINTAPNFPNFEFAEELRKAVGEKGSVLVWARHEQSVLKDIIQQMNKYDKYDAELETWIMGLIGSDEQSGRLIDLNKVTLEHYFHPKMKGSTSLKYVLPAIWKSNSYLQKIEWLNKYVSYDLEGLLKNPYATLPPINIGGGLRVVSEGTEAMRAYEEMIFGLSSRIQLRRWHLEDYFFSIVNLIRWRWLWFGSIGRPFV